VKRERALASAAPTFSTWSRDLTAYDRPHVPTEFYARNGDPRDLANPGELSTLWCPVPQQWADELPVPGTFTL